VQTAERERLIQDYTVGNSSMAVPICAGLLTVLVVIVVVGSPEPDEYAQANRPTAVAAAHAKPVGARTEQHRRSIFEARRVALTRPSA